MSLNYFPSTDLEFFFIFEHSNKFSCKTIWGQTFFEQALNVQEFLSRHFKVEKSAFQVILYLDNIHIHWIKVQILYTYDFKVCYYYPCLVVILNVVLGGKYVLLHMDELDLLEHCLSVVMLWNCYLYSLSNF